MNASSIGPHFERPDADARMAADDRDRLGLVLRLEDQDAAQHFLGLGERAVDARRPAVGPAHGGRPGGILQRVACGEVALGREFLVEVRALDDERSLLAHAQPAPGFLVEASQADELHGRFSFSAPPIPISRKRSSVSLSPKSSSSNICRTSISQSEPSSVGFGNFFVHSTASARDLTLMIV